MRINFYEARLSEDNRTMLVKEKGVNYDAGKLNSPRRYCAYDAETPACGTNGGRTLLYDCYEQLL